MIDEVILILGLNGFHLVDHENDENTFEIRSQGIVNPAEIRTKAAKTLSEAGFSGYYLKEAYYFEQSKYPHRTDSYGYVEFYPTADFELVKTSTVEVKK